MTKTKAHNEKRKEVLEAIILWQEPVHLAARIFNVPMFDWLAHCRKGGWHALNESTKSGRPKKLSADDMQCICDAVTMVPAELSV